MSRAVRWAMVPETSALDAGAKGDAGANGIFDALIARIHEGPISWHLILTIDAPGDAVDDATLPWPPERERIDVGTLTVERLEAEEESEARTVNFDPTILPAGIAPSEASFSTERSGARAAPSVMALERSLNGMGRRMLPTSTRRHAGRTLRS